MPAELRIPAALARLARGGLHMAATPGIDRSTVSESDGQAPCWRQPSLAFAESFANRAARSHLLRQPPIRVPE